MSDPTLHALYAEMLRARLPTGPVWGEDSDGSSELDLLLRALSGDGAQLHGDALQFLEDFLPDTATEFLPDWERVLALGIPSGISDADRRARIVSQLRGFGDPSLVNIQHAADAWNNGAVITQHDYPAFEMDVSGMGDGIGADGWTSTVTITYNGPANPAFEQAMRARLPLTVTPIFVVI